MSFGGNGGASGNGGPPNGNGGNGETGGTGGASGSGGASGTGTVTARGRDWPSVRQFNVFLENRVGALLDLVRRFETTKVRIISISIIDTADCAIIRLVLSDPERAYEILQHGKFMYTESDLLVVQLPQGEQP